MQKSIRNEFCDGDLDVAVGTPAIGAFRCEARAERQRSFGEHRERNAGSDLDHLGRADAPLLVNASSGTRHRAVALGIHCADWT